LSGTIIICPRSALSHKKIFFLNILECRYPRSKEAVITNNSVSITVSCGWALSWVNKPEAKELFEFLNPFLKLPDRCVLGGDILKEAVAEADNAMEIALKEDPVGVTLTFDGWTNVNNEQLLGTVLLTSEGRPYVWKAVDISSERENYTEVIKKIEKMLEDLKKKEINVCAIVTDSTSAYATAWYDKLIYYCF
jgi:hypothetical protein